MTKYKCPECGMEFDKPGKCEMCDVELEEVKELQDAQQPEGLQPKVEKPPKAEKGKEE